MIPSFTSSSTLNPGHYITCAYLVLFGALLLLVLIPYPESWKKLTLKWFPFLHTFRGRGFYMIFLGGLASGLSWTGFAVGICVILIGAAHVILACYFRNTLAPSEDFEKAAKERNLADNVTPDQLRKDMADEMVKQAWENRETIGEAAWENRDTLAKVGTFVV